MITQHFLKSVYDPLTGLFTWLVANSNRIKVGDIAGNFNHDGYSRIGVDGKDRLAWLKRIDLGVYATPEEAGQVYQDRTHGELHRHDDASN